MRRWIFKGLLVVLGVAGFLAVLISLGQWAREDLRQRERYTISFSDIDCEPPPGLERSAFLDEVQYLAGLPGHLCLLDDDLAQKLSDAFSKHPWVAKVTEVELAPPKEIHARLVFRRPVLAVKVGTTLRAVDNQGVLLPRDADTKGLPMYSGKASSPTGPAGTRWGDPRIEKMAKSLNSK